MTESLKNKCKKIKLVLTDVDGVLTDGGRYYSEKGEIMKRFHTRDGMGINILLRNYINSIIITKEKSKIVKKWAREMNVGTVYEGSIKKEELLPQIRKKFGVLNEEIAYIGDDVNDIGLLKKVGFSACPSDSIFQVKKNVNYVCSLKGGEGVVREIGDLILKIKFPSKNKWY